VESRLNRRSFLGGALAAGAALATSPRSRASTPADQSRNQVCAFIKYLQPLGYEELADAIAEIGFDGIEATVRKDGYIAPAAAAEELPKLAKVFHQRGLAITMITTDILRTDSPQARPILETAAKLGIPMYRLGFYEYDLSQPVIRQLAEIKPQLADLAAMNGELGVQGVYQNHSGAEMVGATVWDVYSLIKDLPPEQVDLAFDIRHATVEAGLAWPAVYNAMKTRIATVYVKDFAWKGRQAENVPLGQGRVEQRFFEMLGRDRFRGPISLHVEYGRNQDPQANLQALRRDLATLKRWLSV
jgi:sugar phosphate isomerase/epimerase